MPHRKNGCNGEVRSLAAAAPLRILLRAAPGSQILDLVGPFQVFTWASEILACSRPGTRPVYSLEVVTTEPGMLLTSCGLRLEAARRRLQESNAASNRSRRPAASEIAMRCARLSSASCGLPPAHTDGGSKRRNGETA
jgi:hypothetical protein